MYNKKNTHNIELRDNVLGAVRKRVDTLNTHRKSKVSRHGTPTGTSSFCWKKYLHPAHDIYILYSCQLIGDNRFCIKMWGLSFLLPSLVAATKEQVFFPFFLLQTLSFIEMTIFPKPGDIYTGRLGRDHGGHSPDENLCKRSSQQSTLLQIQKRPLCSTIPEVQILLDANLPRSKLLSITVGNEQTKQLSLSYVLIS